MNRQHWNMAPTSYPRQWLPRDAGMEPGHMRYAPYDMSMRGGARPKQRMDGRRLAPSR
jgi:hypothetical protein